MADDHLNTRPDGGRPDDTNVGDGRTSREGITMDDRQRPGPARGSLWGPPPAVLTQTTNPGPVAAEPVRVPAAVQDHGTPGAEPATDAFPVLGMLPPDPATTALPTVGRGPFEPPTVAIPSRGAPERVPSIPAQRSGSGPLGQPDPGREAAAATGRRPLVIGGSVGLTAVAAVVCVLVVNAGSAAPRAAPAAAGSPGVTAQYATNGVQATVPTTTTTTTEATAPGDVTLDSAVATDDRAATVGALLGRYFTAINNRDYPTWTTTVVARRAQQQPAEQWLQAYRSTTDADAVVTSLTSTGSDSVVIDIAFTSTQDVADAPPSIPAERICWTSRWPIVGLSSGGRIDAPPKGTTTGRAC